MGGGGIPVSRAGALVYEKKFAMKDSDNGKCRRSTSKGDEDCHILLEALYDGARTVALPMVRCLQATGRCVDKRLVSQSNFSCFVPCS